MAISGPPRIGGVVETDKEYNGHGSLRARLAPPTACTDGDRQAFARLVRQAFDGSTPDLDDRIRDAQCLAFHYASVETLAATAALKAPSDAIRSDVFARADVEGASEYELELGWVYVLPAYRGARIGERLCQQLMGRVPTTSVFATTRPDSRAMKRILHALGFTPVGKPFFRRDKNLVLFVRRRSGEIA